MVTYDRYDDMCDDRYKVKGEIDDRKREYGIFKKLSLYITPFVVVS
jgi:hypothetical protein